MNNGWIKLHRSLLEWEWFDDHNTFRVFMYLMLICNFKKTRWRGIELEIGESIKCLETLAVETGLSVRSVRTCISHLKSTGEVTERKHGKHRILKLKNYEKYQVSDTESDSLPTGNRQGSDREVTIDKEGKKEKKEKNEEEVVGKAAEFFEKNFGLLTQYTCEAIKDLEDSHGEQNLIKAMKLSIEAGVRSIRYVRAILDSESVGGYKFEKVPKSTDNKLLGKLPPVIRKQVEQMIDQFIKNTGANPKEANIKLMIEKLTHEKVK